MIRNFFAGIGCLTVLLVLGIVAWIYRADVERWVGERTGTEIVMSEPSPELAQRAEERIQALIDGEGEAETRFTEAELQSYLQYRLAERFPTGVRDPAVDLQDSTLAVTALLDLTRLAIEPEAVANLRRFLGDSARVAGTIQPRVQRPGEGRVRVLSLQAGIIPVPPLLMGTAIESLGLEGDGQDIIILIPRDVVDVRVEGEELVLVRDR